MPAERPQFLLDAGGRRRRLERRASSSVNIGNDLIGEPQRRIDHEEGQVRPHQPDAIEERRDLTVSQMLWLRRHELDVDQLPCSRRHQVKIAANAACLERLGLGCTEIARRFSVKPSPC